MSILHIDRNILVVNKPAGISVTKDRTGAPELKAILARQMGKEHASRLRLIHRLDKDTSGVMVLARNPQSQSSLSQCFEKKQVTKIYLALVTGFVSQSQGTIEAQIARDRRNTTRMRVVSRKGKKAVTDYKLLADFGGLRLLAAYPLTGRTHQVRVHLAHAGFPLAVDPAYGGTEPVYLSTIKKDYRLGKGKSETPLIERLTLHAYQIEFPPETGCHCFVAPLDKKFLATIKMLTKHNPNGPRAFFNKQDRDSITTGRPLK